MESTHEELERPQEPNMVWHQRRTDLGGAAVVLLRARMFWENRSSAHIQSLPYWANLSLVDGRLFVQDSSSGFGAPREDG